MLSLQETAWLGGAAGGFGTCAGAITAAIVYWRNRVHDRRRATLEACERIVLDERLARAFGRVGLAVRTSSFPGDLVPPGTSDSGVRGDLSFVLNYIETISQGVTHRFYSDRVTRRYFGDIVAALAPRFLVAPEPNGAPAAPFLLSVQYLVEPLEHLRRLFRLWPATAPEPLHLAALVARHAAAVTGEPPPPAGWTEPRLVQLAGSLMTDPRPDCRRWAEMILWLLGYNDRNDLAQDLRSPRDIGRFRKLLAKHGRGGRGFALRRPWRT